MYGNEAMAGMVNTCYDLMISGGVKLAGDGVRQKVTGTMNSQNGPISNVGPVDPKKIPDFYTAVAGLDPQAPENAQYRRKSQLFTGALGQAVEKQETTAKSIRQKSTFLQPNTASGFSRQITENRDQEQAEFARYQETLGAENMPKDLAEFQRMKYTEPEKWSKFIKLFADKIYPSYEKSILESGKPKVVGN